jgi:GntR family transcriptional regulator
VTEKWTSTPYLLPRADGQSDAWTSAAPGRTSQQLLAVVETQLPGDIASALSLEPGSTAVCRHRLILLDGEPVELADSYYTTSVAHGTPLAAASKIRGGAPTALAQLGYKIRRAVEDVEQRPASEREAEALKIATGAPVLTLTRTSFSARGEPVEASLMVMKAPRRLRYELEID